MPETKPKRCQQYFRVGQDDHEQCDSPAVEQVGDRWFCESCAKAQKAGIDKWNRAVAQGFAVTDYSEKLRPDAPLESFDKKLSAGYIIHDMCNGYVDLKKVSETHHALICRSCGLRVVARNEVCQTWDTLRQAALKGLLA